MRLYGYWRSGTSHRTRVALNLKGLAYDTVPVNLLAGDQRGEAYLEVNSQGLVPTLEIEGQRISQSLAIIGWLDDKFPTPPLLPLHADERAVAKSMALAIACDIHPLNNARVLKQLKTQFGADQAQLDAWTARWITSGFDHVEAQISQHGAGFAYGATPTMVDCCLIPQVYSAQRFGIDLGPYPHIQAVWDAAAKHPAFVAAHPDLQPDAPT